MANNSCSESTITFLKGIKPTFTHGAELKSGYYAWADFKVDDYHYFVTPDMQYCVRLSVDASGKEKCEVAPHNNNKYGRRPRYNFYRDRQCTTISVARLHAALLIPGCLDLMIDNPELEINHKSYTYTKALSGSFNNLCDVWYSKFGLVAMRDVKDPERERAKRIEELKCNYKDLFNSLSILTEGFSHAPMQPVDNRALNLELCSREDNIIHFKVLSEFEAIVASDLSTLKSLRINYRRIPSALTKAYYKGEVNRSAFITLVTDLYDPVDLGNVAASYRSLINKNAAQILASAAYRQARHS